MRTDLARDLDFVVEQHGALRVLLRLWDADDLDGARWKFQPELARGILQDRTELHQL